MYGYLFVVNVECLLLHGDRCEHDQDGWLAASVIIVAVPAVVNVILPWPFVVEL